MDVMVKKTKDRRRRHVRLRQKITGTAQRPRLCVYRSLRNIYAQLIDDVAGKTLLQVSTDSKAFPAGQYGGNIAAAQWVGKALAEKAKELSLETVVFDRGGRKYHGRIKALADAAREAGLKF